MIIRSQDKRLIEKFRCACAYQSTCEVYVNGILFGVYSSEEKAVEVLDMIFQHFKNMAFVEGVTFQMPQDSEV